MRSIDHFVKNRGKARVMLQIGAGHSNNCQVKLKLFGYDIQIQFQANLEVSEALIIYVTNRGGGGGGEARRRVVLHIGAGHSNNCQIILKLFGYDIFCNNLQQKISRKFRGIRDINHIRYN